MTLSEVADLLPNGLHDAQLENVTIDFVRREARLGLDIWMGDEAEREAYRRAEIKLTGLYYWVSEPPDPRAPFDNQASVRIDVGDLSNRGPKLTPALPPIPSTAFANWIYVNDWNAFVYVAAQQAELTWLAGTAARKL